MKVDRRYIPSCIYREDGTYYGMLRRGRNQVWYFASGGVVTRIGEVTEEEALTVVAAIMRLKGV